MNRSSSQFKATREAGTYIRGRGGGGGGGELIGGILRYVSKFSDITLHLLVCLYCNWNILYLFRNLSEYQRCSDY